MGLGQLTIRGFAGLSLLALAACATDDGRSVKQSLVSMDDLSLTRPADLAESSFVSHDGASLPLRHWGPREAGTVIVGLHGLNDHAGAFDRPARAWAGQGIRTYAYDQRGFGGAPGQGWQGHEVMAADLRVLLDRVRDWHPDAKLIVIGESMGAAIAVNAVAVDAVSRVDGLVLSAPAIRSKASMPAYQRVLGWLAAKLVPGLTITRDPRDSLATDNRDVLKNMAEDPKIARAVRLDAFLGAGQAMDAACAAVIDLDMPVLVLYGARDPIIDPAVVNALSARLSGATVTYTVLPYEQGYHLLFRDLQSDRPISDVATWVSELPRRSRRQLAERS